MANLVPDQANVNLKARVNTLYLKNKTKQKIQNPKRNNKKNIRQDKKVKRGLGVISGASSFPSVCSALAPVQVMSGYRSTAKTESDKTNFM